MHVGRSSTSRHVILFLAANPDGTTRLALEEECAAIERELRMAPGRDDFDFRSKWAVNIDEMMRYLNEWKPLIIHFSGHGSDAAVPIADGQHRSHLQRDIEGVRSTGIYLQDERRSQCVTGPALAKMIASAAPSARVVVLNACSSDVVAESLCDVVDCVVSMKGSVDDDAARSFAVGFYRALGNCRSVGNAVAQAIATLAAKQLPDEHRPVCRTRNGISADQIFLPTP
jgi:CHAT domain